MQISRQSILWTQKTKFNYKKTTKTLVFSLIKPYYFFKALSFLFNSAWVPVGICMTRQALSVVWTPCPPAPLDLINSNFKSCSGISISMFLGLGRMATEHVDVWSRSFFVPVTGTRCTLCSVQYYGGSSLLRRSFLSKP